MADPSGNDGGHLRLKIGGDLPPIRKRRWSPQRKALVVRAVCSGTACDANRLSAKELMASECAIEGHGGAAPL
jgi:Protein of unknown function (DUF1153)